MTTSTHPWGTQPEMFGPRHEHRLGIILSEVRRLPAGARVLDAAIGLGQLAGRVRREVGVVMAVNRSRRLGVLAEFIG